MKKITATILALIFMLSGILSVNVFAAAPPTVYTYPSISSSRYIEFTAQENINVYKDTACKTRGTSSPSKKYNASIAKNDVCYIYKITSSYIQVNYPTSSGRRTGYIKRSSLFDQTSPTDYIDSSAHKVSVYKTKDGGYVAKGDKVWKVDPQKGYSGYRAVIYDAKSGNRAYKMGYVTLDGWDDIVWSDVPVVDTETTKSGATAITYDAYKGVDYTKLTTNKKRITALNKAKQMVTIQWTAPCDFVTWASSEGVLNTTTSIDGHTGTKFKKGKTYTGVPYSMNAKGSRTLDDIAWMKLLNDGISTSMMKGNYYSAKAGTKYGIDCSAFVCESYEAATGSNLKLNTSGMLNSNKFKKLSSFSKLKPGDVFLKNGHVMMFVGKSGEKYAVFEASAGGSKCRYKTYSAADLSSYKAYKYTGFGD